MGVWITELWQTLATAEYGTADLLDAVWDLSDLASTGVIHSSDLERRLLERETKERLRLTKQARLLKDSDWQWTQPAAWIEEAA